MQENTIKKRFPALALVASWYLSYMYTENAYKVYLTLVISNSLLFRNLLFSCLLSAISKSGSFKLFFIFPVSLKYSRVELLHVIHVCKYWYILIINRNMNVYKKKNLKKMTVIHYQSFLNHQYENQGVVVHI